MMLIHDLMTIQIKCFCIFKKW